MNRKLFSLLLAFALTILTACNVVRGSGNVISDSRNVADFDRVSFSGSGDIILTQGEGTSLDIEAEDNIVAVIETEVRDGTLYIGAKANTTTMPTEPVRSYLTMDEIAGVDVSGSGSVTSERIESDELSIQVSGSGQLSFDQLFADALFAEISGSGSIEVAGQAGTQEIEISGSGNYSAEDLRSDVVRAEVSGSGEATVWATDTLRVDIGGSGQVDYYGNPAVTSNVSGSGGVDSLGER